jgi:TetR/AcrR family transcriptional repressor of nem operon
MALSRANNEPPTAERILDIAERLVQTRGFNNFSYADIADELGITKASLHYHYPGKAELGRALIGRYAARFGEALERIVRDHGDARARLEAYAGLYAEVLRGERMCMCGILAAEYETLPEAMRSAVISFFDANERWLAAVLAEGRADGTLAFAGSTHDLAQSILSTLEGAMLVARPYRDPARFGATAQQLLESLAA